MIAVAASMLLLLLFISHYLVVLGNPCIETAQTTSGSNKKTIQSPGFPLVRPPGPYTCTYHLKSHLVDGHVYLVFDDFLSICSSHQLGCDNDKDFLKVYNGANSSFQLLETFNFAMTKRPQAILSSGTSLYVEYIVSSTYEAYLFSGFKATYSSIPSLPPSTTRIQTFTFFENGNGTIHFPVWDYEGEIDVLWLFKAGETNSAKQIYLHIQPDLRSIDSSRFMHLEVLDGISSGSPALLNISLPGGGLGHDISLNSSKDSLYMRLRSDSLKTWLAKLDVEFSFFVKSDECKDIECANGGTWQKIGDQFHCECAPGFIGPRCKKRLYNGCHDLFCANGGTCKDTIYITPYCICRPGYDGRTCEFKLIKDDSETTRECPQNYCFNGGTCHHSLDEYFCSCPPGFYGEFCTKSGVEGTGNIKVSSSKTQYLLMLFLPITLLIASYMVYKFKRKSWPGNYPNQRGNRRHQFYHDSPPSYEQAMVRPISRNWSQEVEMMQTRYEEPPPKYEDVIIVTETNATTRGRQMQSLENGCIQNQQQRSKTKSAQKVT